MKVYNTLSRSKEEFVPLTPGEVRMYVCGVTPYDFSHIGHARSAIAFDVIRRYLRFKGFRVTFVKNYTDVDDRIIRRANERGVEAREVSEQYIAEDQKDMASLGIVPPDVAPKATEHIPEMLRLIEALVAGGFAYVVDGDVYFEVRRFPAYGKLSGKNLEELLAGARVEVDERKRDPRDFALWKGAKPGEPAWASPWGPGRPGWHIECSAMAMKYLGESFDVHGGGEDLIFPHHECEIAQAEAVTRRTFARYWLYNGFVNMGAEKMSKSLGNTLNIRDLVQRHDPEALRLFLIGTHYRSPVEFTDEGVRERARALERLRRLPLEAARLGASGAGGPDGGLPATLATARAAFAVAMDDDFNTPQALGVLFDLSRTLYAYADLVGRGERAVQPFVEGVSVLVALANALGLLERTPAGAEGPADVRARVGTLVRERDQARKRRDFTRGDALRAEIDRLGWSVEDTPSGPRIAPKTGG
ncbi:MAG: cysteine--tRNA ligase [Candidatus Rokubacteria bacterium]|nr:cysteine--tRNA ligase [Candidatus Rokubacteria bacterium]